MALKHAASLDRAALNYVLLHYAELWTDVRKSGENVYQHLKKRERGWTVCCALMKNLACF